MSFSHSKCAGGRFREKAIAAKIFFRSLQCRVNGQR